VPVRRQRGAGLAGAGIEADLLLVADLLVKVLDLLVQAG
jgi:hypothetical protein